MLGKGCKSDGGTEDSTPLRVERAGGRGDPPHFGVRHRPGSAARGGDESCEGQLRPEWSRCPQRAQRTRSGLRLRSQDGMAANDVADVASQGAPDGPESAKKKIHVLKTTRLEMAA